MDRRFRKRIERYFVNQIARSTWDIRSHPVEGWFDLWHVHPDFRSKANRARSLAAHATLQLLGVAEEHFAQRRAPIQIFATLCEDTGSNAVYVHTPNPNSSEFPHRFPEASWGVALPDDLGSVNLSSKYEVALIDYPCGREFVVRTRERWNNGAGPWIPA